MTKEEKAKAYDDAIDKIKYVMEHGVSPTLNKEDLQDIFPELSWSEDERIRKELLEHCRKQAEMYNTLQTAEEYSKVQSWIAWLEKQAEHQNFRDSIQVGDRVTRNEDGVLVNISQLNRIAKKDCTRELEELELRKSK